MKKFTPTHTEKIFWPKEGYTKGDVIGYYDKISKIILPYLKNRPQSMLRQPEGLRGINFFQKNVTTAVPEFVKTVSIASKHAKTSRVRYLLCQNKESLLYMANLGCIEINPWNSRTGHLDNPDFIIFDLDPGDKNTFDQIVVVAQTVRKILNKACQPAYCKTSGKRGLHVYVPMGARYSYKQAKRFADLIAAAVHQELPQMTTLDIAKAGRHDKIYIDIVRNARGQTAVSPYCLRAVPGATVSTPLEWKEVKKGLDPKAFTIKTIFKRIQKKGDLWKPVLGKTVSLEKSIKCLEKS